MKMTKRIFSLALCLVLMMALALPAFAADPTYNLTISNANAEHIYEAYQIFSGKLVKVDDKDVLTDIVWGSSVKDATALMAALEAAFSGLLAVNENGERLYEGAAGVAEYLADNVKTDSEQLDKFAEVVGKRDDKNEAHVYLGNYAGTTEGTERDSAGNYVIKGLGAGYYLVKDKDNSLDEKNEVYTKYIIRVLKDETVSPKGDVPKVDKTINDTLDGTFAESEDFDINDIAYYKWVGTLPSNLKSYDSYYYKFIDTLPVGLDHLEFEQVYLEGHDGNVVHKFFDKYDETLDELPTGITQNVDGKTVTLEFDNLLTLYPQILATHKVVVKYSARVTRDALIADPMTNTVKVVFSNNPNGEGNGDTGVTPPDVAHAFTFGITIDKYDADDKDNKLEGAEFVLYYERTENDVIVKYYAMVVTEEMAEAGTVINGTAVNSDDVGVVYGWTKDRSQASILDTDANGRIGLRGLDADLYYLQETKAPAGYNLMDTPVQIEIDSDYNLDGSLKSVTYEVDSIPQEGNTVGVRNSAGSTLPMTGGVGTTMFYVIGGILVAAAVVLLISRRRAEE